MKKVLVYFMMTVLLLSVLPMTAFTDAYYSSPVLDTTVKITKVTITRADGTAIPAAVSKDPVEGGVAIWSGAMSDAKGEEAALNTEDMENLPYGFIKVTPVPHAIDSNAAMDAIAEEKNMTEEQKRAYATATGIGYNLNEKLIQLQDVAASCGSVSKFMETHGEEAVEAAQKAFGGKENMDKFDIALIFDVRANQIAKEMIGEDGKVELTVEVEVVRPDSVVVLQHDAQITSDKFVEINQNEDNTYEIKHGGVEFLDVTAGEEEVTFQMDVFHLSPFVLYIQVEPGTAAQHSWLWLLILLAAVVVGGGYVGFNRKKKA